MLEGVEEAEVRAWGVAAAGPNAIFGSATQYYVSVPGY